MSTTHIDLGVTGMTCTSCSSRVERKLNKVEGVTATVNYATESASVEYDSTLTGPVDLIKVIQAQATTPTMPTRRLPIQILTRLPVPLRRPLQTSPGKKKPRILNA